MIENYAKEEAWLSGAQSLDVDALPWEQYQPPEARPSLIPSLCTRFTRAGIEWRR